ncbi:MAG: NAD(P)-dependent dehydrogenase, short-chain alcohol dehydrogenase family [Chloroflexi bacterium]|jgi:NAD(P)-dependent dehydrogenase (short-subunit alcohol dehydrogenase family)|nr:MAG: NAD(P)-dependent dehydrogenase, short-chain alcohol dehydrogenase family [Chloroflexota bacterium]
MEGKVCLVTGANKGLGKEVTLALAGMGATVVMVCRDHGRGRAALEEIKATTDSESLNLLVADMLSQQDIRRMAAEFRFKYTRLDVLVNNAGTRFGNWELTPDGHESTFALNHLSSFLLTSLLLDLLKTSAPSRIITTGSSTYRRAAINFDDIMPNQQNYDEATAYDQSKLAQVLFTFELARRLQGTGVTVNCADPGAVDTDIGVAGGPAFRERWRQRTPILVTPQEGARTAIHAASAPEMATVTGAYLENMAVTEAAPQSLDEEVATRLWNLSEELTEER